MAASSSGVMEQSSPCSGRGQELGGGHKNFPFQKQSGAGLRLGGASGLSSGRGMAASCVNGNLGEESYEVAASSTGWRENPALGERPGDPGSSFTV